MKESPKEVSRNVFTGPSPNKTPKKTGCNAIRLPLSPLRLIPKPQTHWKHLETSVGPSPDQ